jgi:hypothetical protein
VAGHIHKRHDGGGILGRGGAKLAVHRGKVPCRGAA